jgi:hypothetical protein
VPTPKHSLSSLVYGEILNSSAKELFDQELTNKNV